MSKSYRLVGTARSVFNAAQTEVELLGCVSTAMPLCHRPCSCYPNHSFRGLDGSHRRSSWRLMPQGVGAPANYISVHEHVILLCRQNEELLALTLQLDSL